VIRSHAAGTSGSAQAALTGAASALCAIALSITAPASRSGAGDEPPVPPDPTDPTTTTAQELRSRIDGLDREMTRVREKIELVDEKLDRLEALLRSIHGERLRRIERIAAEPELAGAITRIEERYALRSVGEALVADDPARLVKLQWDLARAATERGELEFARDPDVVRLVAAMAERREYVTAHGRTAVASILRRDPEAAGVLVGALLEFRGEETSASSVEPPGAPDGPRAGRADTGAHEVALWAALRAKGRGLGGRLSDYARAVGKEKPRLAALANAAAAAHGDELASARLAELVRSGAVKGLFANQLAMRLHAAGCKVAFRVHLELVLDRDYAYTAAQTFGRIGGFGRRVLRAEVLGDPKELHDELKAWLERNWSKLRHDPARRRFTVEQAGPRAPGAAGRPPWPTREPAR
jgi:hypothetical protein